MRQEIDRSVLLHDTNDEDANASVVYASVLCGVIVLGFVSVSPMCRDWFIFPVFLCGVVIGIDAVNWIRGRMDLFDPIGIVGAFGFYFFFLAPLLHVYWDFSLRYVTPPDDWRPWFGRMAWLNFVSLLCYVGGRRAGERWRRQTAVKTSSFWSFDRGTFRLLLALALGGSLLAQAAIYAIFGGISGYIATFATMIDGGTAFQGMGWLFMISESFPIFLMIGYAVYHQWNDKQKSSVAIALMLLGFVAIKILFGGLRGSRANYVWPLFWFGGVIHFWIREIPRKMILFGLAVLIVFMYSYGYYKSFGADWLVALRGEYGAEKSEMAAGRSLETLLLGDLGRADVQAFLLYRATTHDSGDEYVLGWGRTYIGAVALLIPERLWPNRPPSKVKNGTEALFGRMTWSATSFRASNAYGLAGETILNFGPLAVPIAYVLFGLGVGLVRRWGMALNRRDSRVVLFPFLVSLCLYVLVWDSDVVLYYVVTTGLLPFLFVVVTSRKTTREVFRAADDPRPHVGKSIPAST